ncbi:MAG: UDP-glucose/GDP-mannose dehydrogenase family protein [Clostridia bacterium]
MKIAVAGTGYVGLVAGVCFAEKGYNVTCVDVNEEKINLMKQGISPIYEEGLEELLCKNLKEKRLNFTTNYQDAYKNADIIFIGVGTPELPDGSANLDFVAAVSKQIAENIEKDCLVVVKSTVPVGTNDKVEQFIKDSLKNNIKVEVASNPEFLAQGHAVRDTLNAKRIVIGTETKEAERKLKELYKPFNIPIVSVSRRSAEMIKYASNDFLALKISYINDIANLCELVNANVDDVVKGMSYDDRIGGSFLHAGIGYGGSCFPKDTKALKYIAEKNGYELKTVKAAVEVNEEQKIRLFRKAKERMITFKNIKIAILGLTFKAGTDDLREAPSLKNIQLLLKNGANNINVYDPVGNENMKKIYPNELNYTNTPEEALENADICFIFTEWEEIKNISLDVFLNKMKNPLVFDGRNLFDIDIMKNKGIEYYSIGR